MVMQKEPARSSDHLLDVNGLFDAAPEALLVVDEELILHANAQATALCGHDPRGGEITDLITGWIRTQEPFEATVVRSHGEPLPIEVRSWPAEGTLIVSFRDARELLAGREAVSQLFEAEARYRGLVEQVPAVVYEDRGHTTIYVSPMTASGCRTRARPSSPAKAATSTTTAWFDPTVAWCGSETAPSPTGMTPVA